MDPEILSDHLKRTLLAGKNGESQNFLTIDDALNRGASIPFGQDSANFEETTNMIRVVLHRDGRCFPEFALRKSQRMKLRFAAIEPLFKTGA